MKYTITHTAEWVLLAIITALLVFTTWKSYTLKGKIETITVTDTLTIQDTITNWNYDTMYFSHFDTIKLPVFDTVNDTLIKIDSFYVQVPLYGYVFDTTIQDSTYKTVLRACISGFSVSMDTLMLNTQIMPQKVKKQPWYTNICPAVGVGFGTGGFGVFVGVGYKVF